MKINFTKQEYRLLVTMIEIADWVMTAHDTEERDETKSYRDIRKKILSYFKEMDMGDCYNKEGDDYYETIEFEAELMGFIDDYDEESFWGELVSRLADRDYDQKYKGQEVDMHTRIEAITTFEEIYVNEINQNGLLNLVIAAKGKSTLH